MKKLLITFGLLPQVGQNDKFRILSKAAEELEKRTLICLMVGDKLVASGDKLVASYVCEGWPKDLEDEGTCSCPENSFWDIRLEGMRFANMVVVYDNALIPSSYRNILGNYEWRNGESYWYDAGDQRVVVTCLPTPKIVSVSVDIVRGCTLGELDSCRLALLHVERRVERIVKLTKILRRLLGAFNSDPENDGRIRRFTNDLFVNIGRV
jgi:hypothetical protein